LRLCGINIFYTLINDSREGTSSNGKPYTYLINRMVNGYLYNFPSLALIVAMITSTKT